MKHTHIFTQDVIGLHDSRILKGMSASPDCRAGFWL